MIRRLAVVAVAILLLAGAARLLPAERAIVILVSLDGFRADYLERLSPPHLLQLAKAGVVADVTPAMERIRVGAGACSDRGFRTSVFRLEHGFDRCSA